MEQKGKRNCYSIQFKLDAVQFAESSSNRKSAIHYNVNESMIRRWRKAEAQLQTVSNKNKKTKQRQRQAKWPLLEVELKKWVLIHRGNGHQINGRRILQEARSRSIDMGLKFKGSTKWVFNFMKRNNLVRRAVTSTGQHLPANWQDKVEEFKKFVDSNKINIDLCHIGNMDEVPVSFDLPSKFTVAERGKTDIKITTTGHEKCNFTVALAVTADGKKLPPYVIFKRKTIPKGIFPRNMVISANEKGWMSSSEMVLWLDKVWSKRPKSFFAKKSLLILDAAPGHRTEEIKTRCKKLNTIPAMIPGGLTSKLQPLDISINKSFKSKLKSLWEEWMETGYKEFTKSGAMKRASNEEVLGWIATAWEHVTVTTITSGFRKMGINFYGDENDNVVCAVDDEPDSNGEIVSEIEIVPDEDIDFDISNILINGFRGFGSENEDEVTST